MPCWRIFIFNYMLFAFSWVTFNQIKREVLVFRLLQQIITHVVALFSQISGGLKSEIKVSASTKLPLKTLGADTYLLLPGLVAPGPLNLWPHTSKLHFCLHMAFSSLCVSLSLDLIVTLVIRFLSSLGKQSQDGWFHLKIFNLYLQLLLFQIRLY